MPSGKFFNGLPATWWHLLLHGRNWVHRHQYFCFAFHAYRLPTSFKRAHELCAWSKSFWVRGWYADHAARLFMDPNSDEEVKLIGNKITGVRVLVWVDENCAGSDRFMTTMEWPNGEPDTIIIETGLGATSCKGPSEKTGKCSEQMSILTTEKGYIDKNGSSLLFRMTQLITKNLTPPQLVVRLTTPCDDDCKVAWYIEGYQQARSTDIDIYLIIFGCIFGLMYLAVVCIILYFQVKDSSKKITVCQFFKLLAQALVFPFWKCCPCCKPKNVNHGQNGSGDFLCFWLGDASQHCSVLELLDEIFDEVFECEALKLRTSPYILTCWCNRYDVFCKSTQ